MVRTIAGPMLALFAGSGLYGQVADPLPAFEVASVKVAPPPDRSSGIRIGCTGGPGTPNPGTYNCENNDLAALLMDAYALKRYQLTAAVLAEPARYKIMAKVPPGTTKEQLKLMMRNLLTERFKLTYHYEKNEMPVLELTVAEGGPKMTESPPETPASVDGVSTPPLARAATNSLPKDEYGFPIVPMKRHSSQSTTIRTGLYHWVSADTTMDRLVGMLTLQSGRPVIDATGLKGTYDIRITFTSPTAPASVEPASSPGGARPEANVPHGDISIFAAVQKDLGLKLEQSKGMVDMFVVDHAEKTPTGN
jgi:uncharacterized protein (TIGR03435 family)